MGLSDNGKRIVCIASSTSTDPIAKIEASEMSLEDKEFFIGEVKKVIELYDTTYKSPLPIHQVTITKESIAILGRSKLTPDPKDIIKYDSVRRKHITTPKHFMFSKNGWTVRIYLKSTKHNQNTNKFRSNNIMNIGK